MDAVITTEDLRKSFRGRKGTVEAVQGVTFEVGRGEIFGFLGPNGAGKTTTLRMLTTLLPIESGVASVAGSDVGTSWSPTTNRHQHRQSHWAHLRDENKLGDAPRLSKPTLRVRNWEMARSAPTTR